MAMRNNPFKPLIKKIPAPLRNRYFVCLLLFIGWLAFFDRHSIYTQIRLQQQLDKLKVDKVFYETEIKQVQADKIDLETNTEKFARERYHMKKSNEDVFIIVKEDKE